MSRYTLMVLLIGVLVIPTLVSCSSGATGGQVDLGVKPKVAKVRKESKEAHEVGPRKG